MLNNVGNFIHACICSHENFKWILDNVYLKLKRQEDKGMCSTYTLFARSIYTHIKLKFQHSVEYSSFS